MVTRQKCYKLFWTKSGSILSQNSSCTATFFPSLNHPSKTNNISWGTPEKICMTQATFSCELLQMDGIVLVDLQGHSYAFSVRTQDAIWINFQEQRVIRIDGESVSKICVVRATWWWWWLWCRKSYCQYLGLSIQKNSESRDCEAITTFNLYMYIYTILQFFCLR